MLQFNKLTVVAGTKLLYCDVDLLLKAKHRYGIVGANGCGKSTLIKVIVGDEEPIDGNVSCPKSTTIGALEQHLSPYLSLTIKDVVLMGQPALYHAFKQRESLLQKEELSSEDGLRLADIELTIGELDGYTAETRVESILHGLGIPEDKYLKPLASLSGGFQIRVLLAKLLFQNPDILILDEPTNHLDIASIAWLEQYLKCEFKGLLLFVSHDHRFLNQLATCILDIDYGSITPYVGNFDTFQQEKKLAFEQKEKEIKLKNKRIKEMQEYVERFKNRPSTAKRALSRLKMIEKIDVPEALLTSRQSPRFSFEPESPSSKRVIKVNELCKSFENHCVLDAIDFQIHKGERIGIIGANGMGKSTLLKVLMGEIQADSGEFQWGETTQSGYFSQGFHSKQPSLTLIQWLSNHCPKTPEKNIRSALGQMLFTSDDQKKLVGTLSGGECARLNFARLMLHRDNVLLLDEPTNHLDLESIRALTEAIRQYRGTLLLVSHDRFVIERCVNRILALSPLGLIDHQGDYPSFLEKYGIDYLVHH